MNRTDEKNTKGILSATINDTLVKLNPQLTWQDKTCTIHGTTVDDDDPKQYHTLRFDFPTDLTGTHEFGKDGVSGLVLLMSRDGPSIAGGWLKGGSFTITSPVSKTANFRGTFSGTAGDTESSEPPLNVKDGVFDLQGLS
jgi:hypothetical protein